MEFEVMRYNLYENKNGNLCLIQEENCMEITYDQLPLLITHLQAMLEAHEKECD